MDKEAEFEQDPDSFDPENDARDYSQVAKSLPVFTVSSRGYQKLSGRLLKDSAIPAFRDVSETEIPALQDHCRKLTEAGRASNFRRFLNSLNQLRTSLSLWAYEDGRGMGLSDDQKSADRAFLNKKLHELENALDKCVKVTVIEMKESLKENIHAYFQPASMAASQAALPTADKWGAHRDEGGLFNDVINKKFNHLLIVT